MKRQWLAGILFLAGLGYLMGMAWKPSRQGPRLEVSPEVDVGELIHGEERTVRVGFRNTGDQPLAVEPLALACACAKPRLDRKTGYQPGESGWFEVTLKAVASPGSVFRQQLQLDTNDPRAPRQYVSLAGTMQSSLTVNPARLRVDEVVGAPWFREVTVGRAGDQGDFQIVRLSCTVPGVELSEPEELVSDEHGQYQIEVRHPGASGIGQQSGRIEILTNSPTVPRLLVPVDVSVSSHVKVNPSSVLFRADDLQEQHVRLTASSAFQLTSAAEADAWEFQIDPQDETRKTWQVTLRPKKMPSDKPQRGEFPLMVAGIEAEGEVSIRYLLLPRARGD